VSFARQPHDEPDGGDEGPAAPSRAPLELLAGKRAAHGAHREVEAGASAFPRGVMIGIAVTVVGFWVPLLAAWWLWAS
jgi:hypothetical protein